MKNQHGVPSSKSEYGPMQANNEGSPAKEIPSRTFANDPMIRTVESFIASENTKANPTKVGRILGFFKGIGDVYGREYTKLEDLINPKDEWSKEAPLLKKILDKRRYLWGLITLATNISAIVTLSIGFATAAPLIVGLSIASLVNTGTQILKNFYLTRKTRESVIEHNFLISYKNAKAKSTAILKDHINEDAIGILKGVLEGNKESTDQKKDNNVPTKLIMAANIATAAINCAFCAVSAAMGNFGSLLMIKDAIFSVVSPALSLYNCSTDRAVCDKKSDIKKTIKELREEIPYYKNIEELKKMAREQKINASVLKKMATHDTAFQINVSKDNIEEVFNEIKKDISIEGKSSLAELKDRKKNIQFVKFKGVLEDLIRSYGFPRISESIGREVRYQYLSADDIENTLKKSSSLSKILEKQHTQDQTHQNGHTVNQQKTKDPNHHQKIVAAIHRSMGPRQV